MKNDEKKVITGFCPFQTQIGQATQMKDKSNLLIGSAGIPLIKVSCDQEQCRLYLPGLKMCAVSVACLNLGMISEGLQKLEAAIRDIEIKIKPADLN